MTRDEIILELRSTEKDLKAFVSARDAIQRRINEMEGHPRQEMFLSWAGTQATMNVLIMAIVRCEGLIEDYRKLLLEIEADNVIQIVRKPDEL